MRLVMATRNEHKLREVRQILPGIEIQALDEALGEPPETGDTFEANALEKARYVFARTGLPTIADDSGLEVAALGWAPGVRSKRWTPEATDRANNEKLVASLRGIENRRARYRCAMALVTAHGERTAEGTCWGTIALAPRGAGGFGYDPYFLPDAYPGRTMAEVTAEEKHRVSHRGQAFRVLPHLLHDLA
jgi:XTP/dITP diphosphohydrolase